MANSSTLFYNVAEDKASSFKTAKASEKVIGFVADVRQADGDFGYLVAGGKQYGASKATIENIASAKASSAAATAKSEAIAAITVTEKNSLMGANNVKYTFAFTDGKLSVSQYLKTSIDAVASTVSAVSGSGTTSNSGTQFIGTSYVLDPTLTIDSDSDQVIKYKVTNETGNEWIVLGIKYNNSYIFGGSAIITGGIASLSALPEGSKYSAVTSFTGTYYVPTNAKLTSAASKKTTGTVKWAAAKKVSASIASKTFTVYLHEKGVNSSYSANISLAASPASASQEVSAKCNYYTNNSEITTTNKGTATVLLYGGTRPSSWTFAAGLPSFAYPEAWDATPTFTQLGESTGWVEKTKITIDNVPYRVFTAPAQTGSEQTYGIIWK